MSTDARLRRIGALRESRIARLVPTILVALTAAYLVQVSYRFNRPILFYASAIALGALIVVATGHAQRFAFVKNSARTLLFLTLLLPVADFIYAREADKGPAAGPVKPAYSFRDAKGNPKAFEAWWTYYANEWAGQGRPATEAADPKGVLPLILVPNSRARFFEGEIRVNNLGFRGPDIAVEKQGSYRIFALGESPTFGPTIRRGDRPWPEVLQGLIDSRLTCARRIQVVNAGTQMYDLKNNLERMRRDILGLQPDMVLSYHSFNSLHLLDKEIHIARVAEPPQRLVRASSLLAEVEHRLSVLRFVRAREQQVRSVTPSPEAALNSELAKLYRELIELGRRHDFTVVLANSSMAVTPRSPSEVIDFYARVFSRVQRNLAASAVHNRMLESIAREASIPFIDTTPGLDGEWDADLYLDLVHFTQKGSDLLAHRMFEGLRPLLAEKQKAGCVDSLVTGAIK